MSNDKKNLPIRTNKNRGATQLQNSGLKAGSIIESSLANLSPDEVKTIREKAAEEALRLEVKKHEQDIDHQSGSRAINDHIDTFQMLEKNGKLTRNVVKTEVKTGAGTTRIESKSGPACFVATTAYGDSNHPDVVYLRQFRDNTLAHNIFGRTFIDLYYVFGPVLAKSICWSDSLKKISRLVIERLIINLKNRF